LLRKQTADKLKKTEDQVETTPLWHGTDIDSVTKITGGRFDRGHHGKNGNVICNSYGINKVVSVPSNKDFKS